MRFLASLLVVFAVAVLHTVLSASLECAEKGEKVTPYDGLTELKKIDQLEFEAAQRAKAAELNVTEEQNEDSRYLEAAQGEAAEEHGDAENERKEQTGNSEAADAAHDESVSESSEDSDGRQKREHEETVTVTETVRSLDESHSSSQEQDD
uniref:Transmembrane protein n=1 Tax=Nothobranchius kuhntae TaxID=321403 RepID=A0A1A8I4E5_NOTKU